MRLHIAMGLLSVLALAPPGARAQAPGGDTMSAPSSGVPAPADESTAASSTAATNRLSNAGVYRAAARVDSVYVERVNRQAFVEGGDFASYLVARLGVRPVPDNLAIDIGVDTGAVTLSGQVQQLPPAVKAALGPALMFLDPSSVITADVSLLRNQPGVVRFHLRSLLVNGVPLPEGLLVPLMAEVGARYRALTRTGRDLLVAIPEDGTMRLEQGGVRVAIRGTAAPPKTGS
jgi:hypothetical protein